MSDGPPSSLGEAPQALGTVPSWKQEAIDAVLTGSDVVYVFPTGCGDEVLRCTLQFRML